MPKKEDEVPKTKLERLKEGCFAVSVAVLWVSLVGLSFWSLDIVRQNIKVVNDVP